MQADNLTEIISNLSPEEQAAVHQFIQFLTGQEEKAAKTPFLAAIDEFIAAHPDLLRRLAK